MVHPFFDFFNQDRPFIDSDPAKWPAVWKTIQWKFYPRRSSLELPIPQPIHVSLDQSLLQRTSQRDFLGKPITPIEFAYLLYFSAGTVKNRDDLNQSRRPHPSGGALYPIELYPLVLQTMPGISGGIYHYNVLRHSLEYLGNGGPIDPEFTFAYPWAAQAAVIFIFSFIEGRSRPKYGNFSYKVGLIEAGHIGQNFYLNAAALGLKCCALAGVDAEPVHEAIGSNGIDEVAFYSIAVGK